MKKLLILSLLISANVFADPSDTRKLMEEIQQQQTIESIARSNEEIAEELRHIEVQKSRELAMEYTNEL